MTQYAIVTGIRIFLLALLFISPQLMAQDYTADDASSAAFSWMEKTQFSAISSMQKAVHYSIDSDKDVIAIHEDTQGLLVAYIVPLSPRGFIIVSAHQNLPPIIGYSRTSDFSTEPSPRNVLLEMIKYDQAGRIQLLEQGYIAVDETQKALEQWNYLLHNEELKLNKALYATEYGPHLSTTWNQGTDGAQGAFNYYTPGYHVCGCVATAGAQILKYYAWPTTGTGSSSYTDDDEGLQSANYGSTTYDWTNMIADYSGASTLTQKQAVSLLCYHVGVSVEMDYEAGGSGSVTSKLAASNKKYFRSTGEYVSSGEADFYTRLYNNMVNSRPGVLSIRSATDAGHAVCVDGVGYDVLGTNFYHLNFGWGGTSDAFYSIEPLNTQQPPGGETWVTVSGAVIDIFPLPMFSSSSGSNSSGSYTISWNVSDNLNATKYELQEGTYDETSRSLSDGAEDGTGNWITDANFEASTAQSRTGAKSFRAYIDTMAFADLHTLTLNQGVYVTDNTTITYSWMTNTLTNCEAYFQASTDGAEWTTLKTYSTATQAWTDENSIDLSSYTGNVIFVRFAMEYQSGGYSYGNTTGFFVDDFAVNNYYRLSWSTVSSTIAGTSQSVQGRAGGAYYYRVRPYCDSSWRTWSNIYRETVSSSSSGSTDITVVDQNTCRTATGWNMLGLPVIPSGASDPRSLFADDMEPFYTFAYNSNIFEYYEASASWGVPSAVQRGKGYILYGFSACQVDVSGSSSTGTVTLELTNTNSNGWHLLGNPYAATIDWNDNAEVSRGTGISDVYYRWTGNQYQYYPGGGMTNDIGMWQGFWVRTSTDGAQITFTHPGTSKEAQSAGSPYPDIAWRMQIKAESGNALDTYNFIGMAESSARGYDDGDIFELAPLNNEFISLYFPHQEWQTNAGNYTQDIRPVLQSASDTEEWTLSVAAKSSDTSVKLTWEIPEQLEPGLHMYLIDPESQDIIDMRGLSEYRYAIRPADMEALSKPPGALSEDPSNFLQKLADEDVTIKTFTIVARYDDITDITESRSIPDSYFLNQNYPNPFNPSTTIEYGLPKDEFVSIQIYTILGQEIRTLVNQKQSAGTHLVTWDGRNNHGAHVSSGLYIYRLTTNNTSIARKLLLIR